MPTRSQIDLRYRNHWSYILSSAIGYTRGVASESESSKITVDYVEKSFFCSDVERRFRRSKMNKNTSMMLQGLKTWDNETYKE